MLSIRTSTTSCRCSSSAKSASESAKRQSKMPYGLLLPGVTKRTPPSGPVTLTGDDTPTTAARVRVSGNLRRATSAQHCLVESPAQREAFDVLVTSGEGSGSRYETAAAVAASDGFSARPAAG